MQLITSGTTESPIQPDTNVFAERIRGEFREMPGLTLSLAQASRLWSLDAPTCNDVLTRLVDIGFLCRKADGAYARASDFATPHRSSSFSVQADGRTES